MKTLQQKTVLITGASAGVGHAAAHAFAAQGANLVLTARRTERLEALCQDLAAKGTKAVFHAGDAALEPTAEATVKLALNAFGSLDILINNAGIGNYKNLVDTTAQDYDEMMLANMRSSFLFSRHAAPAMIAAGTGEIVFVSSIAGLQGYAGEAVYCATKFAQVGFAQALDAELRPHGIKVAAFCPGGIKSEFALGKGRTQDWIDASHMMRPEEVADALVYLCRQPDNIRIPQMTIRHMG